MRNNIIFFFIKRLFRLNDSITQNQLKIKNKITITIIEMERRYYKY